MRRRPRTRAQATASDRDAPSDFFPRLAAHWKHAYTAHPAGWTAWILSPDMKLPSAMRLKESRRVPMWNGPIECRLFRFDLVAGSARGAGGSAQAGARPQRRRGAAPRTTPARAPVKSTGTIEPRLSQRPALRRRPARRS